MSKKNILIRCPNPNCNYLNEVSPPDKLHPHYSLEKPKDSDVDGDVKDVVIDCRNEKCRQSITIYWYMPKRVFKT
jgi:hypothetical protein